MLGLEDIHIESLDDSYTVKKAVSHNRFVLGQPEEIKLSFYKFKQIEHNTIKLYPHKKNSEIVLAHFLPLNKYFKQTVWMVYYVILYFTILY